MRIICECPEDYILIERLRNKVSNDPDYILFVNSKISFVNSGRKKMFTKEEIEDMRQLKTKGKSITYIAKKYEVCRKTIYKYIEN